MALTDAGCIRQAWAQLKTWKTPVCDAKQLPTRTWPAIACHAVFFVIYKGAKSVAKWSPNKSAWVAAVVAAGKQHTYDT